MSAGEVVIWCFAIVCTTILLMLGLIMWGYKHSDKFPKK